MKEDYDVIIVGAGPAGIFCALELVRNSDLSILILEKGKKPDKRKCASPFGACKKCDPCSVLCGWGGAGAFSDGKLTLSPKVGGWLAEILSFEEVEELIRKVDETYVEFGAPTQTFGDDEEKVREISRIARKADLDLVPARIRHMGTDICPRVLLRMYAELKKKVDIAFGAQVEDVKPAKSGKHGVVTRDGKEYRCRYLVLAPGRSGADWFAELAARLELGTSANMVDIGVRIETPSVVTAPVTDILYEPKLIYYSKSFEDRVRTFCMNPNGEVIKEHYDDVMTVNGHSYKEKKTENTNFALLVDKRFTEPFREPIAYGKYIARLANLLADGILVQRLGDLLAGKRSTPDRISRGTVKPTLADATPGDLSLVLPYRYLVDILEMLEALDLVMPGVFSRNTLLYGVEVKFYGSRLKVGNNLETKVRGIFAAGDGAGITRGLVQASASGLLVGRSIMRMESGAFPK
ncbi:MAG: NAD(P)/FAD-dependent oxidoreductase [Actinomycetota bacterium]|nr:NAD(P)/FAD-dependent oxidoreductase [Actinomycetota bacterium]